MAIRRRDDAADDAVRLKAWRMTFQGGYDFLHSLRAIGIETDGRDQPGRADAEAAWRDLGAAYLAAYPPAPDDMPWALREFGEPSP